MAHRILKISVIWIAVLNIIKKIDIHKVVLTLKILVRARENSVGETAIF